MPKDRSRPFFPFYVDDFVSDDKVEAMTTEQVGAYVLLLCKAWRSTPPASVPNDDAVLARYARVTPSKWVELKLGVLDAFVLGSDGRYHQRRLRAEYDRLIERRAVRQAAGALGGFAKASKKPPDVALLQQCYNFAVAGTSISVESESSEGSGEPSTPQKPPAAAPVTNRPSMAAVEAYYVGHSAGYKAEEVRRAYNFFEATAEDGWWFLGKRRVGDYRHAMEFKMNEYRNLNATNQPTRKQGPDRNAGTANADKVSQYRRSV